MVSELERRCGFQPLLALDEALVTLDARGDTGAALFTTTVPATRAAACLRELVGGETIQMATHGEHLVLATSREMLDATLRRLKSKLAETPALVARRERLATGAIRYDFAAPENSYLVRSTGHVMFLPEATTVKMESDFARAATARELEVRFEHTRRTALQKTSAPSEVEAGVARELIESIQAQRIGRTIHVGASFPSTQGRPSVFRDRLALVIYAVRRYVLRAKTAEARSGAAAIAKHLAASPISGKGGLRLHASAPPVPRVVPSGRKHSVSRDEWSVGTWGAIGYSNDTPLYYSYSIDAAPDGKSAVVRARGDLDATGSSPPSKSN